jgi:spectinomycin phosphotransferase
MEAKMVTESNIKYIEKEYNIKIVQKEPLYIGADKDTFVFKIQTEDNSCYFMKIRTGPFIETSVTIPYVLSKTFGKNIIRPIKTIQGHLFLGLENCTIILYPFIYGKSGWELSLSENQWIEFGALLHEIHTIKLPEEIPNIPCESYTDKWRTKLKDIMNTIQGVQEKNELLQLLYSKKETIYKMIDRAETMAKKIKERPKKNCLCHGDIHAGNVLITDQDVFYIVDWDTILQAPKERDLMFIGGGIGNKWNKTEEENSFYKGYNGRETIDPILITYYRYERILQDIVEYYDQYFNDKAQKKKEILKTVASMFEPDNVVDMAIKKDVKNMQSKNAI